MVDLEVVDDIRVLCRSVKFCRVLRLVVRRSRVVVPLLALRGRHVVLKEAPLEVVMLLMLRSCAMGLVVVLYRSRRF